MKSRSSITKSNKIDLTTFIKWSGNKSRYIKHILPLIPQFTGRYYEPFIGSGAVFLALKPKKWVINDINTDLIYTWLAIQLIPFKIITFFKKYGLILKSLSIDEKKKFCIDLIDKLNKEKDPEKRAIKYLFIKFCVFMGHLLKRNDLYYFRGLELNIQVGSYSFLTDRYFYNINNINNYLNISNGKIYNKNYEDIIKNCKKNDFVFLDPPYIETDLDYQFKYNNNENLNSLFINNLYKNLKTLDENEVRWLMTQADTQEIRNKFKEFKIIAFEVYRNKSKTFKTELLIRNY